MSLSSINYQLTDYHSMSGDQNNAGVLNAFYQMASVCVVETVKLALNYSEEGSPNHQLTAAVTASSSRPAKRSRHRGGRTVTYLRREGNRNSATASTSKVQIKSLRVDPALIQARRAQQEISTTLTTPTTTQQQQDGNNNNRCQCRTGCYKCIVTRKQDKSSTTSINDLPTSFEKFLLLANPTVLGQRRRPSLAQVKRRSVSRRSLDVVYEVEEDVGEQ